MKGSLEENVLSLLCFSDKASGLLSNIVEPDLFENEIMLHIASLATTYTRRYKKAINAHLSDLLGTKLENPLYKDTIENLYDAFDVLNEEFVLNQLSDFLYQQNLKKTVRTLVDCSQDEDYEGIEEALNACKKTSLDIFNPGTHFSEEGVFNFLDIQEEHFETGIPELDRHGICPAPKELLLIIGKSGIGKTWSLNHFGKYLLLQKKKVLHITLEMSEQRVCQRYVQSLFSIPNKDGVLRTQQISFQKNKYGAVLDFEREIVERKFSFEDSNIRKKLKKLQKSLRNTDLIVKEFPTGQLSFKKLVGYLDQLLEFKNFQPDAILLDYPDLMKIDRMNMRQGMARLFIDLRGLAVERNFAMITPTQANRSEVTGSVLTKDQANECADKGFIADTIVTLNQTPSEKQHGLLRLFVDKGRNNKDGQTILISQNLDNGQFHIDSALLQGNTDALYTKLEEIE